MLTVLACCPPTAHFSSCWQKVTRRRHKKEPADKDPIRQIIKGSDPMTYHAEIIAVGTELLLGNIANTDAQELSQALASVGVDVLYHTAVGDNPARLREVVDIARGRANLLVFTGGLGPTYDDMTKQIVCEAFGLGLEFHPEIVEEIRHYFDTVFRREMPACNLQQAYLPRGCTVLHNPVGTASVPKWRR